MDQDVMREIPGFPGQFVTEDGLVYSTRSGALKQKSMRLHNGYYRVNLQDNSAPVKTVVVPVHKLVLDVFVGPRPEGYVCRHLNGNPLDNRLTNICWGTPKENAQDSIRHGTAVCLRRGEVHIASKLSNDDVIAIRVFATTGLRQSSLGRLFGVTQRHISDIVNRKTRCSG